jgi:uncharacterized DUF497 family protein
MEFEWDENKNEINKLKHNIFFEKAKFIFEDFNKIIFESENNIEKRFIILGEIFDLLYSVVYTIRNERIRIISARRANLKEREKYYKK